MWHPDEGLIHAWLDGAATPEEGRAIEEHIAGCQPCSAMVAEARGLIAGASRILTGLDHVPGNVIPAGAPAAQIPGRAGGGGVDAEERERTVVDAHKGRRVSPWERTTVRRWASRPALRAAAAVVLLAGTSWIVVDRARQEDVRFAPDGLDQATMRVEQPAMSEASSSAVATESAATDASSAQQGASPVAAAGGVAGNMAAPAAPVSPTMAPRRESAGTGQGGAREAERQAGASDTALRLPQQELVVTSPQSRVQAPTPGRAAAVASTQDPRSGRITFFDSVTGSRAALPDSAAAVRQGIASGVIGAASQAPVVPLQDSLARRMAAESRRSDTSRNQALGIAAEQLRLSSIVVTGATPPPPVDTPSAAAPPSLVSGGPGVELAGCYAVSIGRWSGAGDVDSVNLPPLLSLESGLLEIAVDGPRLALRAPSDTAASRAAGSYWRVSARDSLLLVWRQTVPELAVHLQIQDPLLSGLARFGDRTAPATARRVGATCAMD